MFTATFHEIVATQPHKIEIPQPINTYFGTTCLVSMRHFLRECAVAGGTFSIVLPYVTLHTTQHLKGVLEYTLRAPVVC